MRHRNRGRKLGRNSSHRRALKSNILQSLFRYGKIVTTLPKAKEYAPHAEKMITLAKRAEAKVKVFLEKIKTAGEATPSPKDIERECDAIRMAYAQRAFRILKNKKIVYRLFKVIMPMYGDEKHKGGYTQVFRLNKLRAGDKAQLGLLKLVYEVPPMEDKAKEKKVLTSEEKVAKKVKEKERKERERKKEKERLEKEKLKKEKNKAKKAKKQVKK